MDTEAFIAQALEVGQLGLFEPDVSYRGIQQVVDIDSQYGLAFLSEFLLGDHFLIVFCLLMAVRSHQQNFRLGNIIHAPQFFPLFQFPNRLGILILPGYNSLIIGTREQNTCFFQKQESLN